MYSYENTGGFYPTRVPGPPNLTKVRLYFLVGVFQLCDIVINQK